MNTAQPLPFPSLFNAIAKETRRRRKIARRPCAGAFGGSTKAKRAERKAAREANAATQLRSMNVFPSSLES